MRACAASCARTSFLDKVSDVRLRDGPWYAGSAHKTTQTFVVDIDLDINVHVRKLRKPSR
jgi:hypothetical protein